MKKLSLRQLSQNELEKREMNHLLGGGTPGQCLCGCGGPSSDDANARANVIYGYTDTAGGPKYCACSQGHSVYSISE